jgi:hypothetical protein
VHVPGRKRCEQHGGGFAAGQHRVPGRRPREQTLVGRLVAHLLDTDDEDGVVYAACDSHRADAKGIRARGTCVLDARARDAGEPDGRRDGVSADALLSPKAAALGRDEDAVDVLSVKAAVDGRSRGLKGARCHLLVALLEQLTELDQSGADHGHTVPAHPRAPIDSSVERVPKMARALNP